MPITPLNTLPTRYTEALHAHVMLSGDADFTTAHELGNEALAGELGTLDMAKIHDQALASLRTAELPPEVHGEVAALASRFFDEAINAIEQTRPDAPASAVDLKAVSDSLAQRSLDLAHSQSEVKREIVNRKSAEAALATSKAAAEALLAESLRLEAHLKDITRQTLTANEDERKQLSLHLQDEIAQTLLGIHVRLLALKNEVTANNEDISREISATQRLVEESTEAVRRYARELGLHHES